MTTTNFETLEALRDAHKDGQMELSNELTVQGISYTLLRGSKLSFEDLIRTNKYGVMIYTAGGHKETAKAAGLNTWLVLLWKSFQNRIIPIGITTTTKSRGHIYEQDQNVVGDTVEVKFTNLPTTVALTGRVDTGATISSLHADSVDVKNGQVRFMSKHLSPNVLTMDLADKQIVKSSDGGSEYRPVVALNVAINGVTMQGMMFNLNNRGQMEHPVLIGQNILEKGRFLINPMKEGEDDTDFEAFVETLEFEEFKIDENIEIDKTEQITELLTLLSTTDVTFEELMRHMRTDAMEIMEKLEY